METPDYQLLREKVWQKAIGTSEVILENHFFKLIAKKIEEEIEPEKVGKGAGLHWHTIRNFFKGGRHKPTQTTLDMLSWYVLGGDTPQTFVYFQEHFSAEIKSGNSEQSQSGSPIQGRRAIFFWSLIIMGIATGIGIYAFGNNERQTFFYHFEHSGLQELRQDGWFLFPDSVNTDLWIREDTTPYLRLQTYLGDSYLENRDYRPYVINILSREIDCGDCCKIQVKLVDFNPYERYQQAGFFLFSGKSVIPSIRLTFASDSRAGRVSLFYRNGTFSTEYLVDTEQHHIRALGYIVDEGIVRNPLDSLVLEIEKAGDEYFFSWKPADQPFIPILSKKLTFGTPRYLGLAAFQGRPDVPYPVYPVADTLAANFEYVRVVPCED